jgi:hypothetical protein
MENFSNKVMLSLQLGHQVAQNTNKTGFPLKSLRETVFPSKALREKGGASFFSGKRWTPKEEQEGQSSRTAGGAPSACRIEMKKTSTPIIINKKEKRSPFFITILELVLDKDLFLFYFNRLFTNRYTDTREKIFSAAIFKIKQILTFVNILLKRGFRNDKLAYRFRI